MSVPAPSVAVPSRAVPRITMEGIRRLMLAVLVVSVLAFTVGVWVLVQRIFDNFGPAVERDLVWNAARGAHDLARGVDLGLALGDAQIVRRAFGEYTKSDDVAAIVTVDVGGRVIAAHGAAPEPLSALFSGAASHVRATPNYLVAWEPSSVEGAPVGRVAIVISTRRLVESRVLLRRISMATLAAGLLTLGLGILFVTFFTRGIIRRDAQLALYASGLEDKVAERTRELDRMNHGMRLVLDNVDQGFITVDLDGTMTAERSTIVDHWFGVPKPGAKFADYVRAADPVAAEWFALSLEPLKDDILPRDLMISQLPTRVINGDRSLRLAYTPILTVDGRTIERLLVVITDITEEIARERVEREKREMMQLFQRVSSDPAGTDQFFVEVSDLLKQIPSAATAAVESRLIHTVKGNCSVFGLESMSELCHAIESQMEEERRRANGQEREALGVRWEQLCQLKRSLSGERRSGVDVDDADLRGLVTALRAHAPHDQLLAITESWQQEPVARRFARLADKAVYLARRLGKPSPTVHRDAAGLRLAPGRWAPFWTALTHAIGNAVEHGIEDPETRLAQGKPAEGALWLTARHEGNELTISLRDDGRGIDWSSLSETAAKRGLAHATEADLVEALFTDGVSTKAEVSVTSGRGVGLAALREAALAVGGRIEVRSERGAGTCFLFRFDTVTALSAPPGSASMGPSLSAPG